MTLSNKILYYLRDNLGWYNAADISDAIAVKQKLVLAELARLEKKQWVEADANKYRMPERMREFMFSMHLFLKQRSSEILGQK